MSVHTFTPPTREGDARTFPGMSASDRQFWSHYRAPPVGVTVWKLTDDTYTQVQPADAATISVTYLGGYAWEVSEAEALRLALAGYSAYVT